MTASVVVVGGGLAGIAAALECADRGARVTLIERRRNLGGLTWSFRHGDMWVDNGQHVFLRCCDEYLRFLDRIGGAADVEMPGSLDIPVVAPGQGSSPVVGRLSRSDLPAPLHLARSLVRYPHLRLPDRLRLGIAVAGLRRLRLDDPALDRESFGTWLARHHQSPESVEAVWDLITVPTVNLRSTDASLAMAAKVFKTGLLEDRRAADIGWSRVPLGRLHGQHAAVALRSAGVEVRLEERVLEVRRNELPDRDRQGGFSVLGEGWENVADAVVVALPHDEAVEVLPRGAVPEQERVKDLGYSAIVDIHLVFDRRVTSWPLMAAVNSPVQWVFDRTESSGLAELNGTLKADRARQYLAVSISAADELLGRRPAELVSWIGSELHRLLPATSEATVVDSLVTKERRATFAATPGSGRLRSTQATFFPGLAVAGAWTDTGWPATMEGAVRSGRFAADACLSSIPNTATGRSPQTASTHQEVA
ncbi:MAG TPA: hydroxysqualene dehydroxylase HpnE [Acidimicrobiales bacterium]|nr:hydroxysqualene dehydroxylase HpnE [Acidimicrobiales bacterium]